MRVQIPTEEFARYCAEMSAADELGKWARSADAELARTDLAPDDRRFVEAKAAHLAAISKKLRDNAERRRNPERGNVVQMERRA